MKVYSLLILVFLSHVATGQRDPLSLTEVIFDREGFPDLEQHITGEYNGHPNGEDLHEGTTTRFLLLQQTSETAVVSINFGDSTGAVFDCYLHFKLDTVWKACAFRSLAMTRILHDIKTELENLTEEEIDQLIEDTKNGNSDYRQIQSREEFDYYLGNLQLILALDDEIIHHFQQNKEAFNRIKNEVLKDVTNEELEDESATPVGEKYQNDLRKLLISKVKTGGYEFGSTLNFSIGGMLDNTVGYLFVPKGRSAPNMHHDRIIMLREIGDGWYMYKTT